MPMTTHETNQNTIIELVRWMKENGVATNQTLLEVLSERPSSESVEVMVDYSTQRVVSAEGPVRRVFGVDAEAVVGLDALELLEKAERLGVQGILADRVEKTGPSLRKVRRLDDGTVFEAVTTGQRQQGSVWAVRIVPLQA